MSSHLAVFNLLDLIIKYILIDDLSEKTRWPCVPCEKKVDMHQIRGLKVQKEAL